LGTAPIAGASADRRRRRHHGPDRGRHGRPRRV